MCVRQKGKLEMTVNLSINKTHKNKYIGIAD